jgi:cytochrome c-type biogenesis protein CcmE
MKKTHVIGIVFVALLLGAIMITIGNPSTYADFTEASSKPGTEFHVVGKCNKKESQEYHPEINTDEFSFLMEDLKGVEKKVVLHRNKPQDFDRSEQIVVIGKIEGEVFHAEEMLLKCPSKYNDGKPTASTQ